MRSALLTGNTRAAVEPSRRLPLRGDAAAAHDDILLLNHVACAQSGRPLTPSREACTKPGNQRQEIRRAERLGQHSIHATLGAPSSLLEARAPTQADDGRRWPARLLLLCANLVGQFQSIGVRQVVVGDHEVELASAEPRDGLCASSGVLHDMSGIAENRDCEECTCFIVFDEQNLKWQR